MARELSVLRVRARLYGFTLILLVALLAAGASIPVPVDLLSDSYSAYRRLVEEVNLEGLPPDEAMYRVFTHNFYVMTLMYIPILGLLNAVQSVLSTGIVVRAVAFYESRSLQALLLGMLAMPSTWLEVMAYSIAATESTIMGVSLLRRNWRGEVLLFLSCFLLSTALLLVAASLEVVLIRM